MFLYLLILLSTVIYMLIKRHYSYWQRMGIVTDEPIIPYGSLQAVKDKTRPFGLVISDIYEAYPQENMVGIYLFFKRAIMVRDAQLVKQIMTTDFASFHDRGVYVDEKNDPLSAHLFSLRGQSWKTLRANLKPSFSSGKLKGMFGTIDDVGDKLVNHMNGLLSDGQVHTVEIKDIMITYAVDIIGSVIFGLDIDSFKNPKNEFRQLITEFLNNPNVLDKLRNMMSFVCPPIVSLLTALGIRDSITYKVRDIIQRTIEFREANNVVRKDLLQLLIQLRNTGKISDDSDEVWNVETSADNLKTMSIDMIAAQAFLFYGAGSETTASTISFTIYELAMYPDILKKVQSEVDECLARHNIKKGDKLSYEVLQEMKYLDLCIMETTRKYPGLPFLNRECTQDYVVRDAKLNKDFTIQKGTSIIIPLLGMHHDPENFPQPNDYMPDRYSEDKMDYNPTAYMPFGDGPRHCIAQRMGAMNSKLALVKMLSNFQIEAMPRKEVEFKFHTAPILVPINGLNVRLSKRD